MIRTLALLCVVAIPAMGLLDPNLKAKFGIGPRTFVDLPRTNSSAAENGWVQKERPDGPIGLESLTMWCPSDAYMLCLLYDDTGYIAGLQIAFDQDIVSQPAFDWETQGYTIWNTTLNEDKKSYYTISQYYVSGETLAKDPATRIANRNSSLLLQDGNVWVTGFNRKLYNISTTTSYITGADSIYTKQGCIPMGCHYFYNVTTASECASDTMLPWFPLIYNEQLIGVGFYFFGKHDVDSSIFDWFEYSNELPMRIIVPRAPQCIYDFARELGQVTLHIYYIDDPYIVI